MSKLSKHIISKTFTIREALQRLNEVSGAQSMVLFITDEKGKLTGTLTDGDIRRGLLAGITLEIGVEKVMNTSFRFLQSGKIALKQIDELRAKNITLVPLIDANGQIVKLISLKDKLSYLPIDALIMAGGAGERLRPLTEHTPKPMLKVGDKPILEHNVDRLVKFGVDHIHISLRYLGNKISEYFGDGSSKEVSIDYVTEEQPLGTLGAIRLVKNWQHDTVLVMNSDLLTNVDLESMYRKFEEADADMCVATVPYHITVPYAIMETEGDQVRSLKEKPTYTYYANAGIYLFKREALKYVPAEGKFDTPDLMEKLIENKAKLISYALHEYWLDIGRHEDYTKAQEDIKHIR